MLLRNWSTDATVISQRTAQEILLRRPVVCFSSKLSFCRRTVREFLSQRSGVSLCELIFHSNIMNLVFNPSHVVICMFNARANFLLLTRICPARFPLLVLISPDSHESPLLMRIHLRLFADFEARSRVFLWDPHEMCEDWPARRLDLWKSVQFFWSAQIATCPYTNWDLLAQIMTHTGFTFGEHGLYSFSPAPTTSLTRTYLTLDPQGPPFSVDFISSTVNQSFSCGLLWRPET